MPSHQFGLPGCAAATEWKRTSAQLEEALDTLKLMEGLLQICSCCKDSGNDKGYWLTVEEFIKRYANIEFSHGICDRSLQRHFPDLAQVSLAEIDQDSPRSEYVLSNEWLC